MTAEVEASARSFTLYLCVAFGNAHITLCCAGYSSRCGGFAAWCVAGPNNIGLP